jgi:hypothetical protein
LYRAYSDVLLLSRLGQLPLTLTLTGTAFLLVTRDGVTTWATHASFIEWGLACTVLQGLPACTAQAVGTRNQAMAYRDAFVKYKAITLPQALVFLDSFQIFQDATFKVVDLCEPTGS